MKSVLTNSLFPVAMAILLAFPVSAAPVTENRPPDWVNLMQELRSKLEHDNAAEATALKERLGWSCPDITASFRDLSGRSLEEWGAAKDWAGVQSAISKVIARLKEPAPFAQQLAGLVEKKTLPRDAAWLKLFEQAYNQLRSEQLPLISKIAFIRRRSHGLHGTNATMFAHRTDRESAILVYDPARPAEAPKMIFETKDGFIWDIRPSYDGRKLLMSYKEANDLPFHVWEIGVDGTGLRQITQGPYHDFNPVYYPDGRIVFCSSRVESYSLCQDFLASALHICDADGSNLRRIDFTTLCSSCPSIMPDGTILCTRWEYNDKNIFSWQGLWQINPDGRQLKLYYGNTITIPNSRYGGKIIPGTDEIMITMAGHHLPPIADIAVIDRSLGIENENAMRKVTFETPYKITKGKTWRDTNWGPGDRLFPWSVSDPWPIRDGLFLAAFGRAPAGNSPGRFGICLALYDGLRFEIYGQPDQSFFSPVTLAEQPLPRAVSTQVPTEPGEGTFFVQDVYQGLLEQGVQRGQVKRLRVIRQTPKKWNTEGPRFHDHYPIVGYGSYYVKENLGEVPVDENGSAYFKAPSNCELYFIALDKDGKEIRRMGSVTQITTGERVSCVGCHDNRMVAPPVTAENAERLRQAPDTIQPPPWGAGPFDYVKHVQPVWDKYCVSCHSGRTPKGGVDMSGGKSRFFNMSYDSLVRLNMVEYYYINPGPTGIFPALQSGSYISKLTALIEGKHQQVNLDDESRRRVYTWIDSNIQYYRTWDMSRPHTTGGRDPWHYVENNQRVAQKPEPWFADFSEVYEANCVSCHGHHPAPAPVADAKGKEKKPRRISPDANHPQNDWINLTDPEFSRVLNAHLSQSAGGLGIDRPKAGQKPPCFKDINDPVYQAMLKAIQAGKEALLARPRMDMPGAVAVPQERNFGKVF